MDEEDEDVEEDVASFDGKSSFPVSDPDRLPRRRT